MVKTISNTCKRKYRSARKGEGNNPTCSERENRRLCVSNRYRSHFQGLSVQCWQADQLAVGRELTKSSSTYLFMEVLTTIKFDVFSSVEWFLSDVISVACITLHNRKIHLNQWKNK